MLVIFARIIFLCAVVSHSFAANFYPASVSDLKSAINSANSNAQNDVIDLGGNTFTLTSIDNVSFGNNGLPLLLADSGFDVTIQNGIIERDVSAPAFRILQVVGTNVSVDNLTIRNGDAETFQGGAIFVNSAGSLPFISNSTFSSNMASEGGAICFTGGPGGQTVISNSTFSGNSAQLVGGAMSLNPNLNQDFEIVNTTITLNEAGQNGGGIFYFNTILTLTSDIIAENSAGSGGPDIYTFDISPATESYNLIGDNSNSGLTAGNPNANNSKIGTSGSPIVPLLGPLANNGGLTQTHALLPGSPAINSGNNPLNLLYDQRGAGYARVRNGAADIGAFEVQDCLSDIDFDGICDEDDACPQDRFNDADGDTICGDVDNCPFEANTNQLDTDEDEIGDACDLCPAGPNDQDADSDGIPDACDYCPDDASNTCALPVDSDEDSIPDAWDNCPEDANSIQSDFDGDGIGDECDQCTDIDGDGVGDPGFDNSGCENTETEDNCPFAANPDQTDTDGDLIGNACDWCPADEGEDNDQDEDGVCDAADRCYGFNDAEDFDRDGIPDDCDNCPDFQNFDQLDVDQNGVGDDCDEDVELLPAPVLPMPLPIPAALPTPVPPGGGSAPVFEPEVSKVQAGIPAVEKAPEPDIKVVRTEPKTTRKEQPMTYSDLQEQESLGGCSLVKGKEQSASTLWLMMLALSGLWLRRRKSA